jgi:hypothetical protein
MDSKQPEGRIEFVDVAERMDARVFFGDSVPKKEIGLSLVTAAGSYRHAG